MPCLSVFSRVKRLAKDQLMEGNSTRGKGQVREEIIKLMTKYQAFSSMFGLHILSILFACDTHWHKKHFPQKQYLEKESL